MRDLFFLFLAAASHFSPEEELEGKVDDLDATQDREASEESHGASNQTQLGNQGHLIGQKRKINIDC